jgi:serine/threonine protein phosphatase PrpC
MLKVVEQAYMTDTGRQRHANEDALLARSPLFAVADGMGGAQAGEVASQLATEALEQAAPEKGGPESYLRGVVQEANERIHDFAQRDASRSGMGTTLTAALVGDEEISFAHVGDSRAYLFRDGELHRLTHDHSLVEELRRQGRLTEAQAEDHPQRSIITRALGPEPEVDVDTQTRPARAGDVYLLCSDGLTTMIPERRIANVLSESPDLDTAVTRLVAEANEKGGRDNITVVAFRLGEEEEALAAEQPTLVGPAAEEAGLTAERVAAARAERREAPPPAAGRRWPGRLARAFLVLLIVAGVGAAAYFGNREVYFLGVDEGGRVALYRGLPYDLPLGVELYQERYSSPVQLASLPADRRDEATDHELRSEDDAESLIEDLENAAVTTPIPDGAGGGGQPGGGQPGGGDGQAGGQAGGGAGGGGGQAGGRGEDAERGSR